MMNYIFIAIVVVMLGVAGWMLYVHFNTPTMQETNSNTATASTTNYLSTLSALSAENFTYFGDANEPQEPPKRTRGDADLLLKDRTKAQKPSIIDLYQKAKVAMDALIAPADQKLCFATPTTVEQMLQNIGSVIYASFQAQADLTDTTYMYSLATLMLIRYSLVAVSEDKRDLVRVVRNTSGQIESVNIRPKMARLFSNVIDKVFDRYFELSPKMQQFVDANQSRLEQQFAVPLADTKATSRGNRKDSASKAAKKNAIMSNANRTMSLQTFATIMVLLASNEVADPCELPSDDVAL